MKKNKTPDVQRRGHLRYRYGIEPEDYDRMLADQDGKCYICDKMSGETKGTKLYIDHDHDTGEVRKLLCARCNTMTGIAEDPNFERVLQYLEEHNGHT